MADCRDVETNLAAYVDGEPVPDGCGSIDAHLRICPQCQALVTAERTAHELLRSRCQSLRGCAPDTLRYRCAAQRQPRSSRPGFLRRPWLSLSLAATGALAVAVLVLFTLGSSVETFAAQLAADHHKCFQFPPGALSSDPAALSRDWLEANGWPLRIAPSSPPELELVGMRRCGTTQGRLAHLLYKWHGTPLSVFVLDRSVEGAGGLDSHDGPYVGRSLGEQEIIWSARGRTYAVVSRMPQDELRTVAMYVRRRTE
jgi:anti-sigma factor RsiW